MKISPPAKLRQLPLNTLAPNILTLCALCSGLTAIRFAILEQWKFAVAAIAVAALLDTLDGRVARLLKGASRFGAELDSLSDFLCFGIAPAMVLYFWSMHDLGNGNIGWLVVLAYSTCTALRLARFNTALDEPNKPVWTGSYFTGIPSPAGAGICLLWMILSFEVNLDILRSPFLNALWALMAGGLMVSRVPTFSFKRLRVKREMVLPVLLGVGAFAALAMNEPWITLFVLGSAYLASIPLAVKNYQRDRSGSAAAETAASAPNAAATEKPAEPPQPTMH